MEKIMKSRIKASLNLINLENTNMRVVKGRGDRCCCACAYEGTKGGSSTADNADANIAGGLVSPNSDCYQED